MHFNQLPAIVQTSIRALADSVRAEGVRLFVFGSFARGDARSNSDLDVGYEFPSNLSSDTELRVLRGIGKLPTIRPIDLVDFRDTTDTFKRIACETTIPL